jgi:hypothetical protein
MKKGIIKGLCILSLTQNICAGPKRDPMHQQQQDASNDLNHQNIKMHQLDSFVRKLIDAKAQPSSVQNNILSSKKSQGLFQNELPYHQSKMITQEQEAENLRLADPQNMASPEEQAVEQKQPILALQNQEAVQKKGQLIQIEPLLEGIDSQQELSEEEQNSAEHPSPQKLSEEEQNSAEHPSQQKLLEEEQNSAEHPSQQKLSEEEQNSAEHPSQQERSHKEKAEEDPIVTEFFSRATDLLNQNNKIIAATLQPNQGSSLHQLEEVPQDIKKNWILEHKLKVALVGVGGLIVISYYTLPSVQASVSTLGVVAGDYVKQLQQWFHKTHVSQALGMVKETALKTDVVQGVINFPNWLARLNSSFLDYLNLTKESAGRYLAALATESSMINWISGDLQSPHESGPELSNAFANALTDSVCIDYKKNFFSFVPFTPLKWANILPDLYQNYLILNDSDFGYVSSNNQSNALTVTEKISNLFANFSRKFRTRSSNMSGVTLQELQSIFEDWLNKNTFDSSQNSAIPLFSDESLHNLKQAYQNSPEIFDFFEAFRIDPTDVEPHTVLGLPKGSIDVQGYIEITGAGKEKLLNMFNSLLHRK